MDFLKVGIGLFRAFEEPSLAVLRAACCVCLAVRL